MESPKGWLGGWFDTVWFDKSLLNLNGNFNKNYRLLLKRLYGCTVLNNQDFRRDCRKSPSVAIFENSPTVKSTGYVSEKIWFMVFRQSRNNSSRWDYFPQISFFDWRNFLKSLRTCLALLFDRIYFCLPRVYNFSHDLNFSNSVSGLFHLMIDRSQAILLGWEWNEKKIRVLYKLSIVSVVLFALLFFFMGFGISRRSGLFTFLMTAFLAFLFMVTWSRVILELVSVISRMENRKTPIGEKLESRDQIEWNIER